MSVKIHIGQKIKEEAERQNLSKAELGRRINKTRPSIYHLYKSKSVDSELLHKVSEVLGYNFFAYYTSTLQLPAAENVGSNKASIQAELEQCHKENEQLKKELTLKDKLIHFMEEKFGNRK